MISKDYLKQIKERYCVIIFYLVYSKLDILFEISTKKNELNLT